jgi:uncharacterized protein YPO0396
MTEISDEYALDFAASDSRAGFRLQRFEIYNWGTFHGRVWTLAPAGENSLLTGDIGSGKSTLVDALTTLLVPAQRITYNKAAGAGARERTLRSYVLGHYKSERGEPGLSAKAVALRDHNSYSVILGQFYNAGYDRHVTLAQIFWIRDSQGQPARFYVVADRPLTVAEAFAGFGSDIGDLRKRLRRESELELHDSFPPYAAAFRRRFGIDNDQALELFNQTVSMKSVGNLTEFVRGHMLEAFPVHARIEALVAHFDDLDRAHQAVLKARDQIAALEPLAANVDRHGALAAEADDLRACRDALRAWFATLKSELLGQRIDRLETELEHSAATIETLSARRRDHLARRDDIKRAIADNGGDRLERLEAEIERLEEQRDQRQNRASAYAALAERVGLPEASNEAGFGENRTAIDNHLATIEARDAERQNRLTELTVEFHRLKELHEEQSAEITSLRRRGSNLPATIVALRERLCADLEFGADALPFAGELIQVRDEERDWEGAIERVLRNFALSLLVPDAHYARVASWVDDTRLRGRLVYYRVRAPRDARQPEVLVDSLVRKLLIKPDSEYWAWLDREIARRFDYVCCSDIDGFRREQRALTRAGQTKSGDVRHEKDDRYAIDDRARYVLGWNNEAKIAVLESERHGLEQRMQHVGENIAQSEVEQKRLRERERGLLELAATRDFRDLDWRTPAGEIQRARRERTALEEASDVLAALQRQLRELEEVSANADGALTKAHREHATTKSKCEDARHMLDQCRALMEAVAEEIRTTYFARLDALRGEALAGHRLTVESCDNRQADMREWLQARIDAEEKKLARLRDAIIDAMRSYKTRWPLETSEVDVSLEAAGEYKDVLARLRSDDLPRFESHFKALLNENTIREVAGFQAQLNREREEIRERIDVINRSLHEIDFNPNRYIALLAEPSQDAEIAEFRTALRACTEGTLTGSEDEQYSEAKFLQVKSIIERLRGREGSSEIDARWTRKVTDVRNWFVFSASERWREDESEHEHYTDSGGKSGGQKEKLAYTVLAASLAYQFGLEWGEQRSRSFRFVVIDEAFGRGSDESTRYGLELFRRLNLQLLIVTPLQKIHIIEPYVSSVGFVHNEDGRHSLLRNLSIEEYRAEEAARRMVQLS